jgi:hypothetical protein
MNQRHASEPVANMLYEEGIDKGTSDTRANLRSSEVKANLCRSANADQEMLLFEEGIDKGLLSES